MPSVGPLELAIVLIIALVIFGPKKLPELGNSLGRGMREFKDSLSSDHADEDPEERAPKGLAAAKPVQPESVEPAGPHRSEAGTQAHLDLRTNQRKVEG